MKPEEIVSDLELSKAIAPLFKDTVFSWYYSECDQEYKIGYMIPWKDSIPAPTAEEINKLFREKLSAEDYSIYLYLVIEYSQLNNISLVIAFAKLCNRLMDEGVVK